MTLSFHGCQWVTIKTPPKHLTLNESITSPAFWYNEDICAVLHQESGNELWKLDESGCFQSKLAKYVGLDWTFRTATSLKVAVPFLNSWIEWSTHQIVFWSQSLFCSCSTLRSQTDHLWICMLYFLWPECLWSTLPFEYPFWFNLCHSHQDVQSGIHALRFPLGPFFYSPLLSQGQQQAHFWIPGLAFLILPLPSPFLLAVFIIGHCSFFPLLLSMHVCT